eukprot:6189166-Pleurochrysis_carterae.AAC.2
MAVRHSPWDCSIIRARKKEAGNEAEKRGEKRGTKIETRSKAWEGDGGEGKRGNGREGSKERAVGKASRRRGMIAREDGIWRQIERWCACEHARLRARVDACACARTPRSARAGVRAYGRARVQCVVACLLDLLKKGAHKSGGVGRAARFHIKTDGAGAELTQPI